MMTGIRGGRRQLKQVGIRPLRRLRGNGSGLRTGATLLGWMCSMLLEILSTVDAFSMSRVGAATAFFRTMC